MAKRDLLSIADLSSEEIRQVVGRASLLKEGEKSTALQDKSVAMLFEKPSLRTRVSFDVGIKQLGGHPVYLGKDEVGLGGREAISDVAQVLSRYVDAIVARVYQHQTLEELAKHASVPVINALSDVEHPCQALGDIFTIQESLGKTDGVSIAFVGDGNNVAASLALAAASMGAGCTVASPEGYEIPETLLRMAGRRAKDGGAEVVQVGAPEEAVAGADVVYTDVWVSMGQEDETKERLEIFKSYQVNPSLMELAKPGAIFMHPLPAHHGEEVGSGMLEHPASVVFNQAENRLHAQKAVLEKILEGTGG